jgi:hypothetical protein
MFRAALAYAERLGFAVFPCQSRGKIPLTEHGFKDAAKEPVKIRGLWERSSNVNVAIATGVASGIIVLDVDPRHGGDEALAALEAEHNKLCDAPTVITGGGGLHLYFRHPGFEIRNSAGLVGPGLDVRADGGYVIAPPSIHPSGHRYYWEACSRIDELPLAEPPEWLLRLIQNPPVWALTGSAHRQSVSTNRSQRVSLTRMVAGVSEGQRDDELFRLACSLRCRGHSQRFVEKVVVDVARRCHPPFPDRLARLKVKSAWRYA